ncbi:MAG: AI-2E family transporter, partial [Comamonadaceae bacterium]
MQFTPTQKRAAAWLAIAFLAVLALWLLGPVLTPFVVAAVLAYALTPLVDRIDALWGGRMPRVVAVVVVELLFLVTMVCLVLLIVPILAKEIPLMREQLPLLFANLDGSLSPWLAQFGIHVSLDLSSLREQILKYLNANIEDMFGSVLSSLKLGGSLALTVVGSAVLIPVALFYLLLDW